MAKLLARVLSKNLEGTNTPDFSSDGVIAEPPNVSIAEESMRKRSGVKNKPSKFLFTHPPLVP
jgi:hypothetical protein